MGVKSACVVGHGRSLTNMGLGTFIDSHDIVIRMANCDWQDKEDYGTKYDVGIYTPQLQYFARDARWLPRVWWNYCPNEDHDTEYGTYRDVGMVKLGKVVEQWRGDNKHFSRGSAAVIIAAEILDIAEIVLIGADMLKWGRVVTHNNERHPKALQDTRNHIGRSNTHEWMRECEMIRKICSEKHILLTMI